MVKCIFCGGTVAPHGEVDLCLVCGKFQPEPEPEPEDGLEMIFEGEA